MMMPDSKHTLKSLRGPRRICIGISPDEYDKVVDDPVLVRSFIDNAFDSHPELFPEEIDRGYELKDSRVSIKLNIRIRRILVAGNSWSIHPSFAMPYMTGFTKDTEKPLLLRKYAVPFWVICLCFGKNAMYWYRMEMALGRNSLVGTTVKFPDWLPEHTGADEKHTHIAGEKAYVPLTVGDGCVLGAAVTKSAGQKDLEMAYGVFKQEARNVSPGYAPKTVNTDGWRATANSWKTLFPFIAVISCFLHIYIGIRDRSRKKFGDVFRQTAEKLWNCYHADTKGAFSQRVRRLCEWCENNPVPAAILDKIIKLRSNLPLYAISYDYPGSHRTSNMTDRLMRTMDRFLFNIQYFHGNLVSANLCIRAWALIHNFAPSNPQTVLKYDGLRSPAERINNFRYHENWLENLLISASMGGFRSPPQNPL